MNNVIYKSNREIPIKVSQFVYRNSNLLHTWFTWNHQQRCNITETRHFLLLSRGNERSNVLARKVNSLVADPGVTVRTLQLHLPVERDSKEKRKNKRGKHDGRCTKGKRGG